MLPALLMAGQPPREVRETAPTTTLPANQPGGAFPKNAML